MPETNFVPTAVFIKFPNTEFTWEKVMCSVPESIEKSIYREGTLYFIMEYETRSDWLTHRQCLEDVSYEEIDDPDL